MSLASNQQQPTASNNINIEAAKAITGNPLQNAYESFENGAITGLSITQIGLLVQIQNIKCDLNRTFLLDNKAAYFNKLATVTNSTPYQRRKE